MRLTRVGRRHSRLASCLLLLAVVGCRPDPPRFENLVLIVIDTLRSDHLASYGYGRATSPFLDGLAGEGVQLQGYSVSSWTKPSVATLLTGLYPQRHQAIGRADALAEEAPYLPEILVQNGFQTAAFVANLNAGRRWGFQRGFSRYEQTRPIGKARAEEVNARVFPMLQELRAPFALYLHYVDPHDPYRPLEVRFGDSTAPQYQPRRIRREKAALTPVALEALVNQYDGEILELDRQLGALFEGLESHGLLEGTLVAITSDHGEEFGEHGGLTHGRTLFEEVLKVPLILWSQGGSLPHDGSREVFFQLDFLPTVLEALGLPPLGAVDGVSRWKDIAKGLQPGGSRLAGFHLDLDRRAALAVIKGPLKLIHRSHRPHDLLFALDQDPREAHPIEDHDLENELRLGLVTHHNELGRRALGRRLQPVDDDLRRGLAALGYLDGDSSAGRLAERTMPVRLPKDGFRAHGNR